LNEADGGRMQGSTESAEVLMPFYEYECQACGAHHEAMQKMNDAPLRKCPDCGKPRLVRLISAPVFRLKGGGWYETDFKSDKENKRNLAGGEEKTASESDAESPRKAAKKAVKPVVQKAKKPVPVKARAKAAAKAKAKPKAKAKAKSKAKPKVAAKAKVKPKVKGKAPVSNKPAARPRAVQKTAKS